MKGTESKMGARLSMDQVREARAAIEPRGGLRSVSGEIIDNALARIFTEGAHPPCKCGHAWERVPDVEHDHPACEFGIVRDWVRYGR